MSEITLPSDRKFGLVIGGALAVAAGLSLWHHKPFGPWLGGGALLVLSLAAIYPAALHQANRAWMALGRLLGTVVTPVVLGILFYLIFTPIGFLMRAFGRDALRMKMNTNSGSYWIKRQQPSTLPESFREQG